METLNIRRLRTFNIYMELSKAGGSTDFTNIICVMGTCREQWTVTSGWRCTTQTYAINNIYKLHILVSLRAVWSTTNCICTDFRLSLQILHHREKLFSTKKLLGAMCPLHWEGTSKYFEHTYWMAEVCLSNWKKSTSVFCWSWSNICKIDDLLSLDFKSVSANHQIIAFANNTVPTSCPIYFSVVVLLLIANRCSRRTDRHTLYY